jgi:putative ABC transport system substrate-binding protein
MSGAITASAFGLTTIAGCGLVSAQPQLKRLGWLFDDCPGELVYLLTAFRDGLREVGWVEGQNLSIDARQQIDRLPALAAKVVALSLMSLSGRRYSPCAP